MIQNNNPSKEERYLLLEEVLKEDGREEDLKNIIKYLSPPPDITTIAPPGSFKNIKVGIIGGGLSGLASAVELRKLGYDITVFESSNRIGGRVYTHYFDKDKSLYGELGAMRIPISHETTWYYIDKFNLNTRPFIQSNKNTFLYAQGVRIRAKESNIQKYFYPLFNLPYSERNLPFSYFFNQAYTKKLLSIPSEERIQLITSLPKYTREILDLDNLSNRDAYEIENISENAINLIQAITPLERGMFYNNLIETLSEEYVAAFSILYEIIGGLHKLPEALFETTIANNSFYYSDIPKQDLGTIQWKFNSLVNCIYSKGNKRIINYFNNNESYNDAFDLIICAIPFSSLRNVDIYPKFSNRKMQAIRQLNYAPLQKSIILFEDRFWEFDTPEGGIIGGGSSTDLPIGHIWYPSDHAQCVDTNFKPNYNYLYRSPMNKWKLKKECTPYEKGVLTASYNAGLDSTRLGNLNKPVRDYKLLRQVEIVHGFPPGYLDNLVLDIKTINWNRKSFYLGGVCNMNPSQKRIYSYNITLPELNNTIFFAGEHISSTHGWMQGALLTGMNAANSIAYQSLKMK
ncbi:FAD-dependent oxidoreductase [Clostridium sp. D2Q-14]|uniref:flavin monoamine oxidase family protein n=1 Tax=Anaeromonas gelatinilytica TaxID=2683194 RepID=UPI00193BD012|nr:NAD(P)/FAD-dependent oxidoreductase [Anaeromonas gelatinilytica]MBS4534608.1 FAD-dependent oxidoreductase [Anaeromonas gelatinilytica]